MHPADWVVLDPVSPRLAHPHSYIHELFSKHLARENEGNRGGSLALWSLFTALVGPLGDPLRRMDLAPTSTFMAACNQICNGFSGSLSRVAQLLDEGAAQDLIDAAKLRVFADNMASLFASFYRHPSSRASCSYHTSPYYIRAHWSSIPTVTFFKPCRLLTVSRAHALPRVIIYAARPR